MCRTALLGEPADSHLDDLESFYWVLCFILSAHHGPGLSSSQPVLSPEMKLFVMNNSESAAHSKGNHFALPFGLPLASFWGGVRPPPHAEFTLFLSQAISCTRGRQGIGTKPAPRPGC